MKVVFMGTPDFAVATVDAIAKAGHEIVMVVTQPDKPKGRGKEMQFPAVKTWAVEHDIPVYPAKAHPRAGGSGSPEKTGCGYFYRSSLWADPSKGSLGDPTIWLCQRACFTFTKISWRSPDPMGGHEWR